MAKNICRDARGGIYQIITTEAFGEDGRQYVVYQELKPKFRFLIMQEEKFRKSFYKYNIETEYLKQEEGESAKSNQADSNQIDRNYINNNQLDKKQPELIRLDNKQIDNKQVESSQKDIRYQNLMAFLDADTIKEKMDILSSIRNSIDESMITSIEMSIDIPAGSGDIDSRIDAVKRILHTHERYEGRRLR